MGVRSADLFEHLRRRQAAVQASAQARAARLRNLLPDAARLLRERFGARSVLLFGSLARGDVHGASDVDLAVEGLPESSYLAAHSALLGLFLVDVDLVPIEDACPSLRERIAFEGTVL